MSTNIDKMRAVMNRLNAGDESRKDRPLVIPGYLFDDMAKLGWDMSFYHRMADSLPVSRLAVARATANPSHHTESEGVDPQNSAT